MLKELLRVFTYICLCSPKALEFLNKFNGLIYNIHKQSKFVNKCLVVVAVEIHSFVILNARAIKL